MRSGGHGNPPLLDLSNWSDNTYAARLLRLTQASSFFWHWALSTGHDLLTDAQARPMSKADAISSPNSIVRREMFTPKYCQTRNVHP